MTANQLDIRSDHIVLSRDRVRIPILHPQNLIDGGAIGELRNADQEIEILQSAERFVEHRPERCVALHRDRGRGLPQLPGKQRPTEQLAVGDDRIMADDLGFSGARGLDLDETVDKEVELGPPIELLDDEESLFGR